MTQEQDSQLVSLTAQFDKIPHANCTQDDYNEIHDIANKLVNIAKEEPESKVRDKSRALMGKLNVFAQAHFGLDSSNDTRFKGYQKLFVDTLLGTL